MTDETTLPEAEGLPDAGAGDQQTNAAPADDQQEAQQPEAKEDKPERHPLEKELAKERRRISRLVEQREMSRAEVQQLREQLAKFERPNLQNAGTDDKNSAQEDADVLKIPRSELPKVLERIRSEADSERENRQAVARMAKALGDDFQAITNELAEILPSADLQFAVAASDAPAELARYLIDPDNAEEAERIARLSPLQAGRALARIEAKLTASKSEDKPQPSKAATPLQPVRGSGGNRTDAAPTDIKAYMEWANKRYGRA